ncbi:MAG: DUF3817 domain-containing protein [Polyangiaceae bacterium]|nr:DUF3817 domain-containing protein [Polyangiaceae bacterium]
MVLRVVALLEGVSFLVLLLVAMPLKYIWAESAAVRVVGALHGALFIAFVGALVSAATAQDWPLRRWLSAFVLSLIPGGTFFLDRELKRDMQNLRQQ